VWSFTPGALGLAGGWAVPAAATRAGSAQVFGQAPLFPTAVPWLGRRCASVSPQLVFPLVYQ